MSTLKYQSLVYAGGQSFQCVESYESVFERMRELAFQIAAPEGADEDTGLMRWAAPLELTVRGEDGPLRLALNPTVVAGVLELPASDRVDVDGE